MKALIPVISKIYSRLMHLYPPAFRKDFSEEMLLDFSEMLESAGREDIFSFLLIVFRELRDYPFSLLSAHLKEDHMSTAFRSETARNTLRGAFAFGLASAAMWTAFGLISSVMHDQGWSFLLRIAISRGWHLNYNATAQTVLYFSGLILGSLLAGLLLALCFWEMRRIGHYLLASLLGFTAPLAIVRAVGSFLNGSSSATVNSIFFHGSLILIGLGYGILFSLILQHREKTPWLLLAGVVGYYVARNLGIWMLDLAPVSNAGLFSWNELVFVVVVFGLEGMVIGALLGAISGSSGQKMVPGGVT